MIKIIKDWTYDSSFYPHWVKSIFLFSSITNLYVDEKFKLVLMKDDIETYYRLRCQSKKMEDCFKSVCGNDFPFNKFNSEKEAMDYADVYLEKISKLKAFL